MIDQAVTEVDVLFGSDAVDPRPEWALMPSSLQLSGQPKLPIARLSVLHGRAQSRSDTREALRVKEDGKFKFVQISDTHMVTGVGVCKDAIDADGNSLPESEADSLTVGFIGKILDVENPDLVILTGDQLHHDILDSKSALFKVVAPIIERSIPFAAVFGNHDSEGIHALSRTAQMSILQNLPFSLCESGPEHVDGIGNFCLQILAPAPSESPLSTLYFLDSHGQIPSKTDNSDYDHIKQSQIMWFRDISQTLRRAREKDGISALGCGHDHVNDFCALLPQRSQQGGDTTTQLGPWLCYGGGSGFGGYCSYDGMRFHRRTRVWELDTGTGSLKTWKRVEYVTDRVDELVLVESGVVVDSLGTRMESEIV
ncbi:hypothetical protein CGMCC3_g17078 [Colletotrichum fructicola]|nr:uncharacterized protein CGMCC3_g17078 [Colletotrichum fructicola]KAE9566759.1 hypothetical protein CGMCC3_g17078 [Colletotrichum fructicola]